MLHKSLLSITAAFAAATSVTASTTPVVRNGGECNTGTLQCCYSTAYSSDPIVAALESFADIAIPVDTSIPLGIACFGVLTSAACTAQPVCCQDVSQNGLINVGCTPVSLGL